MKESSASVVLYNTPRDKVDRLLDCIHQSKSCNHLYVIDNSPETDRYSFTDRPWITYIKQKRNLGYGAGHNVALRAAIDTSEFHFILNPDVYFETGELQKMLDRMRQDPRIGQLMPKVTYPDGSLQYLCKLIPSPWDLISRRFLNGPLKFLLRKRMELFELRFTNYEKEMDVPYLSGCFMLFRTSALRQIGLFDEQFFMYPEDIDITRRMNIRFHTLFFPGATIIHEHARESYTNFHMLFIHVINIIRYFNKWGWFSDSDRRAVNQRTLELLRNGTPRSDLC